MSAPQRGSNTVHVEIPLRRLFEIFLQLVAHEELGYTCYVSEVDVDLEILGVRAFFDEMAYILEVFKGDVQVDGVALPVSAWLCVEGDDERLAVLFDGEE
jgi:hypothetical protein